MDVPFYRALQVLLASYALWQSLAVTIYLIDGRWYWKSNFFAMIDSNVSSISLQTRNLTAFYTDQNMMEMGKLFCHLIHNDYGHITKVKTF